MHQASNVLLSTTALEFARGNQGQPILDIQSAHYSLNKM